MTSVGLDDIWIVGPGRMGQALGSVIRNGGRGANLVLVGRASGPPRNISPGLEGVHYLPLDEVGNLSPPDTVILTVPDDSIPEVAGQLASLRVPAGVILHTSGALSSAALAPLSSQGWKTGSLHPLVAVPDPETGARKLSGAWFGIEGSREAVAVARGVVDLVGGHVLPVNTEQKPLYHAAAVMASNHVVALLDVAVGMMVRCGIDRRDASTALGDLARGAAEDVSIHGALQALTGPVARGDVQTLRAHLDRLSGDESRLYSVLAREALRIAAARGLSPATVATIEATLGEKLD